ncbi:unnamed protein product [Cunninghamella blakesleeana]
MEEDKNTLQPKIALITGVNYERLLELTPKEQPITILLANRNYSRTSKVRDYFLNKHPKVSIDILELDLNSVSSVLDCCNSIKKKYEWIDYLFLNAGYLSALGIKWNVILPLLFKDPFRLMESSDATLQCTGEINEDGIGKVFASCVFGHYIMMRELEPLLSNTIEGSRVIWTSSSTAFSECFDINDWQGIKCKLPYESSKWACDLLAIASNDYFQQHHLNITSFTTSPAVVASRIGNLPLWIIYLRICLHYLFRIVGLSSQNITGYKGGLAAVFVALQPIIILNTMLRYTSLTTRLGKTYVQPFILENLELDQAWTLFDYCENTYQTFLKSYEKENVNESI